MFIKFNIEITASSAEDLDEAVVALTTRLGGRAVAVYTGDTSAAVSVAEPASAPAKGRGRKSQEPAPEVADAPAPEPAKEEAKEEAKPTLQTVAATDMAPAKAREDAIAILQQHFGANPNNMSMIQQLRTKYGVNLFSEISDDQAASFLADAKLVQSGNFTGA